MLMMGKIYKTNFSKVGLGKGSATKSDEFLENKSKHAFFKVCLALIFLNIIFEEKKHTLNPDFILFVSISCSKSAV